MEMTYTYDPSKITDEGKDQMRFELQDIAINGASETCVLSDQEYEAVLGKADEEKCSWKEKKYRCIKIICMRMAYEIDFSADGVSMSMSSRYERWQAIKDQLEKEMQFPTASPAALGKNSPDGGHYFHYGMDCNPRAWPCPCGFGWGPFRKV